MNLFSKLCSKDIEEAKLNKEKFNKIYLYTVNEVYSYGFYITGNKSDAEDVTSESYLRVIKNIYQFEGDINGFRSWVYKIVRNTAYELLKKRKTIYLNDEILDKYVAPVCNENDDEILVNQIWKEIMSFDSLIREILILKYKNGYSYEEISNITGESTDNLRQIVSRTLKKLKLLINNEKND